MPLGLVTVREVPVESKGMSRFEEAELPAITSRVSEPVEPFWMPTGSTRTDLGKFSKGAGSVDAGSRVLPPRLTFSRQLQTLRPCTSPAPPSSIIRLSRAPTTAAFWMLSAAPLTLRRKLSLELKDLKITRDASRPTAMPTMTSTRLMPPWAPGLGMERSDMWVS